MLEHMARLSQDQRSGCVHDTGLTGVQMVHEALDRAALAGGVAALEQHHEPLPRLLRPDLDLEQFGLKPRVLRLIGSAFQQIGIGVFPGLEGLGYRIGRRLRGRPGSGRARIGDKGAIQTKSMTGEFSN